MPFSIVVVVAGNDACNKSAGETQERHANHLSEGAATAAAAAAGRGVSSDASSCQSDTFVVAATVAASAGGNCKEASGCACTCTCLFKLPLLRLLRVARTMLDYRVSRDVAISISCRFWFCFAFFIFLFDLFIFCCSFFAHFSLARWARTFLKHCVCVCVTTSVIAPRARGEGRRASGARR